MSGLSSKLTYKGFSVLPLLLFIPLAVLSGSDHWAYDEAMTCVNIVDITPAQLFHYEKFRYANHHLLNSLYFHFLYHSGADLMWLFRLPSLLAFFFYYFFIAQLLTQQDGYKLNHIDQLMLFLWPYSIYFAQARGYSIAMVAFLGALYFFKLYLKEAQVKNLLFFVLLSCLACISIFSFLFPFAAMMVILGLQRFKEIIRSPVRIIVLAICLPAVLYVVDKGQLVSKYDPSIIASDTLFRGGTLSSMISFMALMDFAPDNVFVIFKWLITLTLIPVLILMVTRMKMYVEITIVLVTLLLLIVAHYAMGAMYPLYRGVAYMVILLLLSFAYSNFKRNIFYTTHFLAIIVVGCTYLGYIFWFKAQKSTYDVLTYSLKDKSTILIDHYHMSAAADNYVHFDGKLDVVTLDSEDTTGFNNTAENARYIVCQPERMSVYKHKDEFEEVYPVASFFYYNKVFYKRKGH